MNKKLILIKPIEKAELSNKLFEVNNNRKDTVESYIVFNQLRSYLESKNFNVATIDKANWEDADYIIFFDLAYYDPYLKRLEKLKQNGKLKSKLFLVLFESELVNPRQYLKKRHKIFDKVLTWKSDYIDNKKYFKYFIPEIIVTENTYKIPFKEKDFLCIVNSNKIAIGDGELYSERKKAILFFDRTKEGINVYGHGWNQKQFKLFFINFFFRWKYVAKQLLSFNLKFFFFLADYALNLRKIKRWKGSAPNPLSALSQYKFAICFENSLDTPGYITEKIFNCFNARCVPIYLGTKEIRDYIPDNCYIDMRKFRDYKSLYTHLLSIDEKKYNNYISQMGIFMKNQEEGVFSNWNFIRTFYDFLIAEKNKK